MRIYAPLGLDAEVIHTKLNVNTNMSIIMLPEVYTEEPLQL